MRYLSGLQTRSFYVPGLIARGSREWACYTADLLVVIMSAVPVKSPTLWTTGENRSGSHWSYISKDVFPHGSQ